MGLEAIYPKPRISQKGGDHRIYPYLLRNMKIVRPNQVWSTDITYIPMAQGFMYLVAILDWYSRFVLSWRLSNSLESSFCVEALEEALSWQRPEIFNSDQGVQFTSCAFTSVLEEVGVAISMDGRGRVFDNIFVERLWRTVKYEDIYLKDYESVPALRRGLREYLDFYCYARFHQSLDNLTPWEVYTEALSRKEQRLREKHYDVAAVKRRAYSHI
jgi:putative transposase